MKKENNTSFAWNLTIQQMQENKTLPNNYKCKDCIWFPVTCSWLLQNTGEETSCDWLPMRFKLNEKKTS